MLGSGVRLCGKVQWWSTNNIRRNQWLPSTKSRRLFMIFVPSLSCTSRKMFLFDKIFMLRQLIYNSIYETLRVTIRFVLGLYIGKYVAGNGTCKQLKYAWTSKMWENLWRRISSHSPKYKENIFLIFAVEIEISHALDDFKNKVSDK